MAHPALLHDLRRGLACLYSLHPPPGSNGQLTLKQAQDYLIQFQGRNIRRKIISLQQRQRDQQALTERGVEQQLSGEIITGSSWLACLALLCQVPDGTQVMASCTSERLFAAQTLAHRLRKAKLVQAVDLEIEHLSIESILQFSDKINLSHLEETYKQWVSHLHPLVGAVVKPYVVTPNHKEERIKGELTLLTLVALSYINACTNAEKTENNIEPILNTLGVAIAATALRLRYSPESICRSNGAVEDSKPIVAMITHAFSIVQSVSSTATGHFNFKASAHCLCACLAAIPDTLLSSPDCSSGRLSIDPRCLQAASNELRGTGISLMWDALRKQEHATQSHQTDNLIVFERWARFLPLPSEFVEHTIPLVNQCLRDESEKSRKTALAYLIAIYEGGTWTYQQVLSFSLGLTSDQQQNQANKKRQSSRSKKRHKELLDTYATDSIMAQASAEVHHRGEMACQVTVMTWDALRLNLSMTSQGVEEGQGDGPIGCLAACATACLPHLIRSPSKMSQELFVAISEIFQELCASPSRYIRSFSYEPLYALHSSLIQRVREHGPLPTELQDAIINHFFKCSLNLATLCNYPPEYFNQMESKSDEPLEIERNDIRDILRSIAGSEEGGSTSDSGTSRAPLYMNVQILARLLKSCADVVYSCQEKKELFPEIVIHTLSALAKPLNQLSKSFTCYENPDFAMETLKIAMGTLSVALQILIEAFPLATREIIFPLSRVCNLAIAAFSPMISALCLNQQFQNEVSQLLKLSVQSAALSLVHLPELMAPSVLDDNMYDIRGAMRGPGGEDHVGCLTLMRLASESDDLTRTLVHVVGGACSQLCELHGQLKSIESSRGRNIFHGEGVTPQSRRILLQVLCHMEIVTGGQAGCAALLTKLFESSISDINSLCSSSAIDEEFMFRMTETAFDIAVFSPIFVSSLFRNNNDETSQLKEGCIRALVNAGIYGYKHFSTSTEPTNFEFQWTRFRAAIFKLLHNSASPDLSDIAADAVVTLNRAECDAIYIQLNAGPASSSSIFHDEIISCDAVPAGIFIKIIGEIMEKNQKQNEVSNLPNCIKLLHTSMPHILQGIMHSCPEPLDGFEDPRPTLCEAWLLVMNQLIKMVERRQVADEVIVKELLVETCASLIALLFYPTMAKTRDERAQAPGMGFDGPNSLALTEFLSSYFSLGSHMLRLVVEKLMGTIRIYFKVKPGSDDPFYVGISIIGAALFRAAQGALPPWAVEYIPAVYSSLFIALERDPNAYSLMLNLSMEVHLDNSANGIGSVKPGQLLGGKLFLNLSDKTRQDFIKQTVEICKQNNIAGWKRLKVIVKQLSGGKKKDMDFRQKPAATKWDFERI